MAVGKRSHLVFAKLLLSLILLGYGVYSSLHYLAQSSEPQRIICHTYPSRTYDQPLPLEMSQGVLVKGSFTAKSDYLGIVAVKFDNRHRVSQGVVSFKIREFSSNDWYYSNSYSTDQFRVEQNFTFGFPIIVSSKGKTYEFEIRSLEGKPGESVYLAKAPLVTKHQYDPTVLGTASFTSARFIIIKIFNILLDYKMFLKMTTFFGPFILYVTILNFPRTLAKSLIVTTALWLATVYVTGSLVHDAPFIISITLFILLYPTQISIKSRAIIVASLLSLPLISLSDPSDYLATERLYGRIFLTLIIAVLYQTYQLSTQQNKPPSSRQS